MFIRWCYVLAAELGSEDIEMNKAAWPCSLELSALWKRESIKQFSYRVGEKCDDGRLCYAVEAGSTRET